MAVRIGQNGIGRQGDTLVPGKLELPTAAALLNRKHDEVHLLAIIGTQVNNVG